VVTSSGVFTLSVSGPGFEKVTQLGHGAVGVTLFGTTTATTFNVVQTLQRPHAKAIPLQIGSLRILSGQIGSIQAGAASLVGTMTPLGGVTAIQFAGLGLNARIDVTGAVGSLGVTGSVNLGPNGHVLIGGDLGKTLSVGSLNLDGGLFAIGHNLAGALNVGGVSLTRGGKFLVGNDVSGAATVTGNLVINTSGLLKVGHNLGGLAVTQAVQLDTGGQLLIGNDVTGPITINGALSLSNKARFGIGRDVTGTGTSSSSSTGTSTAGITVTGDLALASGAILSVNRDLSSLTVNGNLTVEPFGSLIAIGGNLNNLTVDGLFRGQGSSSIDLGVGLDLGSFNVLGGGANQGGIQQANIDVGKSILGVNVTHGIFNSFITAGVLIDGGTPGPAGNVGPDGTTAIKNSQIRAGVQINHLTISGDVLSTFAQNPESTGFPTRIVAGEDRQGNFSSGGNIDNFQITGALIDSVLAASVAPNGGDGTLPPGGYGPPRVCDTSIPGDAGNDTYDAPAGTVAVGTVGAHQLVPNYTELSYFNERITPPDTTSYDTKLDPTIDDCINFGSINRSFASAPLPATSSGTVTTTNSNTSGNRSGTSSNQSGVTITAPQQSLADAASTLPIPTKSTVLGGVISTTHGDEADFAGIFAADTSGVFIGTLPQ
jgi:hypothetical protein